MTTATQPRARTPQPQPHSDFKHGPVAAAFNATWVTMCITTTGKLFGLPPWLAVLAGAVMTACLIWTGKHRRPRPLSGYSIGYRSAAMAIASGWMFWQLADFPDTAGVGAGLAATVVALLLLPVGFWAMRLVGGPYRLLPPLGAGLVATFLVVSFGPRLMQWIATSLTTTARLPCCGEGFGPLLPWLGPAALSLVLLAAPLTVLGVTFANRERTADEEMDKAQRAMAGNSMSARAKAMQTLLCNQFNEWTDRRAEDGRTLVARIPNLRITEWEVWDNKAGETYTVDLRNSQRDTVPSRVNSSKESLVTRLNLPNGCGVEVLRHPDYGRGFIRVEVSRKDTIAASYDYPACTMRSILAPLPVGIVRNGDEIGPILREHSAFLWGQKGSGKTVTVWDIIAGAIQCTDCLVWVIDLNAGAAAAPFLSGFEDGSVDRPCIDWVATEIAEVRRMAEVGLAMAVARKRHYRALKRKHNVNLMPVGNGGPGQPPPGILIVIDEGAEVLGIGGAQITDEARAAREALDAIMRLARDAAVNIVFSGLRATSDVADPAFKAGTAVRIGMRVTDAQELAYGFGDWHLDPADIPYQGSGFICTGHAEDTKVFKGYFLDQARMEQIGIEVTDWRPFLDPFSVGVGGQVYADRWRRTAHKIFEDPRPEVVNYGGLSRPAGPVAGTAAAVLDRPTTVDTPGTHPAFAAPADGDGWDAMMKTADKHKQLEPDEPTPTGGQPPANGGGEAPKPEPDFGEELSQAEYDAKFAALASQIGPVGDDPSTWTAGMPLPPDAELAAVNAKVDSRAVLENLLRLAGPAGLQWTMMWELLCRGGDWGPAAKMSPVAMRKLLRKPGSDEPVEWLAPRERGGPYVHISHYRGGAS